MMTDPTRPGTAILRAVLPFAVLLLAVAASAATAPAAPAPVLGTSRGGAEVELDLTLRQPTEDDCGELSQGPMNACFATLAKQAEAKRAEVYAAVERELEPERRAKLAALEKAWRSFVEAQCRFEADDYEGGSLQPTIYSGCLRRHLLSRTAELELLLPEEP